MSQPNPHIAALAPYQPGTPISQVARQYELASEDIVKLASNENPLGMGQRARQAIEAAISSAHRYPEQYELVQALATHHQLSADHIMLGNGTNDVIDLIARTYLAPGDEAVSSQYAFIMFNLAATAAGATNVIVPARGYGHDLAAMLQAITPKTKLVYIVNPNNPTGTFLDYDDIQKFIEQVPPTVLVLLDEAYYEYLRVGDQANTPRWLHDYPNLIITRTFSKVHGLAGLRVGYALTSAEIASYVNRVRQPFNVNHLALAAATAALGDHAHVVRCYNANAKGREQLLEGLEKLHIETLPSYGNFITFRAVDTEQLCQALLKTGVIVRPLANYGMDDWLRVTIGLPEENRRFLYAVENLFTPTS